MCIAAEKGKMRLRTEHKMREKGWEELTFVSQPDSMETRPLIQDGAARPRPFAALTTPVQEEGKEKGAGKQAKRAAAAMAAAYDAAGKGRGWRRRGRRGCAAMGRESADWGVGGGRERGGS
jgi:hypothetical protein